MNSRSQHKGRSRASRTQRRMAERQQFNQEIRQREDQRRVRKNLPPNRKRGNP